MRIKRENINSRKALANIRGACLGLEKSVGGIYLVSHAPRGGRVPGVGGTGRRHVPGGPCPAGGLQALEPGVADSLLSYADRGKLMRLVSSLGCLDCWG